MPPCQPTLRLTDAQKHQFVHEGFVCIENAFSPEVAADARAILWHDTGCDPSASTWTRPVIRLGDYPHEPFRVAANSPALHTAFDDLVGKDDGYRARAWGDSPSGSLHPADPGDTGWHIDASFPPPGPSGSYFDWRVNVRSDGRALLMLFLFSDVGENDAPTRIRKGSHLVVARLLAPAGENGMSMIDISKAAADATADLPEALATGEAGTVYLCHPFIVHAAQPHRGTNPKFMGQPPLIPAARFELERADRDYSLVERAIRLGLGRPQVESVE